MFNQFHLTPCSRVRCSLEYSSCKKRDENGRAHLLLVLNRDSPLCSLCSIWWSCVRARCIVTTIIYISPGLGYQIIYPPWVYKVAHNSTSRKPSTAHVQNITWYETDRTLALYLQLPYPARQLSQCWYKSQRYWEGGLGRGPGSAGIVIVLSSARVNAQWPIQFHCFLCLKWFNATASLTRPFQTVFQSQARCCVYGVTCSPEQVKMADFLPWTEFLAEVRFF